MIYHLHCACIISIQQAPSAGLKSLPTIRALSQNVSARTKVSFQILSLECQALDNKLSVPRGVGSSNQRKLNWCPMIALPAHRASDVWTSVCQEYIICHTTYEQTLARESYLKSVESLGTRLISHIILEGEPPSYQPLLSVVHSHSLKEEEEEEGGTNNCLKEVVLW